MSIIEISKSIGSAFIVDKRSLEQLSKLLIFRSSTPSFKVTLKNGEIRHCSTVDEVNDISNLSSTAIIKISSFSYDVKTKNMISVVIDASFQIQPMPIVYIIEADGTVSHIVQHEIENWILTVKPWYSRIAVSSLYLILLRLVLYSGSGLIVLVIGSYIVLKTNNGTIPSISLTDIIFPSIIGVALGIIFDKVFSFINNVKNWFFPIGVFATGEGIRNKQMFEKRRDVAFIVIILGLIVNIVAAFIYSRLG